MDASTCDFLLMRDWFVTDESITELLELLSDEDFWTIYDQRTKYPKRARMIIEPNDFKIDYTKLKVKFRELTDEDIERIEQENYQRILDKIENEWINYKNTVGIETRPSEFIDDRIVALEAIIAGKNDQIDSLPRGAESLQLQKKVLDLKNELSELKEQAQELDEQWEIQKRVEFEFKRRYGEMPRVQEETFDHNQMQM